MTSLRELTTGIRSLAAAVEAEVKAFEEIRDPHDGQRALKAVGYLESEIAKLRHALLSSTMIER